MKIKFINSSVVFKKSIFIKTLDNCYSTNSNTKGHLVGTTSTYSVRVYEYVEGMHVKYDLAGGSCIGISYWSEVADVTLQNGETYDNGLVGYDSDTIGGSGGAKKSIDKEITSVPTGTKYIYLTYARTGTNVSIPVVSLPE